jgi:haloacetate dehalogenase
MSDFFPGFAQRQIETSGATINLVTGGSGPPLLLLHGYPHDGQPGEKVIGSAQDAGLGAFIRKCPAKLG